MASCYRVTYLVDFGFVLETVYLALLEIVNCYLGQGTTACMVCLGAVLGSVSLECGVSLAAAHELLDLEAYHSVTVLEFEYRVILEAALRLLVLEVCERVSVRSALDLFYLEADSVSSYDLLLHSDSQVQPAYWV
jgi:hypothetical protein